MNLCKDDFKKGLLWCLDNDKLVAFQIYPIETLEGQLMQRIVLDLKIKEKELKDVLQKAGK